jgi:N-acetylneuraminate synthase
MDYEKSVNIGNKRISINTPSYFIADIASNHDGDIDRAISLIHEVKKSGANAVKFQHFLAEKIVSDYGFKTLKLESHQNNWEKSVFDTYKDCECNREWLFELIKVSKKAKIDLMTTPYDLNILKFIKKDVVAYKIGSGDITWLKLIEEVSKLNKTVLLATGASNLTDCKRAVESILKYNSQIVLMQCNTNYTGSLENFKYINLNVLKTFSQLYPNMVLGLSDHTPGYSTVLGAIMLGARVIEKHFTDDNSRIGPDHSFSLNSESFLNMINKSRELENALGDGVKRVEENEKETIILQRRCLRIKNDLKKGIRIESKDLEVLRPAPHNSIPPYEIKKVIGKKLNTSKIKGDVLKYKDLTDYIEE